jgi:hypothetical protein
MNKIQHNALSRERLILEKIKAGEVSFRSHFKYEHTDWLEIVDFLLAKIHREIMREFYYETKNGPYPPDSMPEFDDWLTGVSKKGKEISAEGE